MLQQGDIRELPPAPPPCPTSLATGRSSDRKTSRICSKCWVRKFQAPSRGEGAGVLGGGYGKERVWAGIREWEAGHLHLQERGHTPGSPGVGLGHLNPAFSGKAPTNASSCSDSACESGRNQKHKVGIPWGGEGGLCALQKLQTLHSGREPGSLPHQAPWRHPSLLPLSPLVTGPQCKFITSLCCSPPTR